MFKPYFRFRTRLAVVATVAVALISAVPSASAFGYSTQIGSVRTGAYSTKVGPKASKALSSTPTSTGDMTGDVIYQLITDRFYDGDTSNNNPTAAPNEYSSSHSNWQLYWGGDFAGVTAKIQYLADLGVGAIWISPPVENINVPVVDSSGASSAGYHGYWGMDYFVPDPHFGSWAAFDAMVAAAHAHGIKVVMDWAANDTSPEDTANPSYAADGALKQNGSTLAEYDNDPSGYFHHNGGVSNYEDPYQAEYENLFNLADLAQENPAVTTYLENAVNTWLSHGVDGIRMDAVKHMPGGFVKSYMDHVYSGHSVFVFGEWADPSSASMWGDEVKFANTDGASLENFDLNSSLRDVFASGASMSELDSTISREESSFTWPNQMVDFVDNQDESRFLSVDDNTTLLDEATVVDMTAPGIPSIYYGDEQYLHNDSTNGSQQVGGDPYNRPMMNSFSENTKDFGIVKALAGLRKGNPALRYGSSTERWINSDVYVYERKFYGNVVLVAVNKGGSDYTLSNLHTALPAGSYPDVLNNSLGGGTLTVGTGTSGDNPTSNYVLKGGQAAVWSYVAPTQSTPEVGNIGPTTGHSADVVAITGRNFGSTQGAVTVGGASAAIDYWSDTEVDFTVPSGAPAGDEPVQLTSSGSLTANPIDYEVETGSQTPVTFTVTGTSTSPGDEIYLTGSVPELGSWSTDSAVAVGPALDPNYPSWFVMASIPSGVPVEYKFFVRKADGTIVWEGGANHTYTAPTTGTGAVTIAW